MMKIYKIFMIILFCGGLLLGGYLTITTPDIKISDTENRTLKQMPKYSKKKLMDGSLFSEFDEYFRDQIAYRKKMILWGTKIDMAMDKKKFNNVVLGKDGYLLEFKPFYTKETQDDIENSTKYLSKELKELSDHVENNNGKFLFTGVPTQSYFNSDKYMEPFNSAYEVQANIDKSLFSKLGKYDVNYLDMKNIFKGSKEQLYYKTDHHYNENGAYITYSEIINNLKDNGLKIEEPYTKEELKIKTIDKTFRGSWNSSLNWLHKSDDRASFSTMKPPSYNYLANYEKKNKMYYDKNKNYTSYGIYMDGDKAEQIIKTNRPKLPNVLIFGDSYTNAVEPLLFMHFNETRILDFRSYFDMNIYDYIEKYEPDAVVYITSNTSYTIKNENNDFKGQYKKIKGK